MSRHINVSIETDIARLHSHVSDVGEVSNHVAQEDGCYYVAKCIDLSADRNVASHKSCVSDISDDNIGVIADEVTPDVTDHIASDVTDHVAQEDGCYYVAKNVYLSADRNIASHESSVSDVSDDNICVVADDIASDIERLNTGNAYSFEQRTITAEEWRPYVSEGHDLPADVDLTAYRYVTP